MTTVATAPIDLARAETLTRALYAAVTSRRIYPAEHQRTRSSLQTLVAELNEASAVTGRRFRLAVTDGVLVHEGMPLDGSAGRQLAYLLGQRECGGIAFSTGLPEGSAQVVVNWLSTRIPNRLADVPAGVELLAAGDTDAAQQYLVKALAGDFRVANEIHATARSVLDHVMDDLRAKRSADFSEILELTRWTAEEAWCGSTPLVAPTQNLDYDQYTFNHSVNVFLIATTLLQPLARDPEELATIAQAALLHDVGKTRIPREVLLKKDKLTEDEMNLVRLHPVHGALILQNSKYADPTAIEVAYCHHMRDDGLGYPRPTMPVRCGPVTNIVQVADMFEALTAPRPYRDGLEVPAALDHIVHMPGMESKRAAVVALLQRLTCSPTGSLVRLSSGERAVVTKTFDASPDQPLLRVFENADGTTLSTPHILDLRETGSEGPSIVEVNLKPTLGAAPRMACPVRPADDPIDES